MFCQIQVILVMLTAPTHHQNQGSQALCQGLAEQRVTDLEAPCQLVQKYLLFSHDAALTGRIGSVVVAGQ